VLPWPVGGAGAQVTPPLASSLELATKQGPTHKTRSALQLLHCAELVASLMGSMW
jgi:hypothetical protein